MTALVKLVLISSAFIVGGGIAQANPSDTQPATTSTSVGNQARQAGFDLIDAALEGDIARATELLKVPGIDVELGSKFFGRNSLTALSAASEKGHLSMVKLLLDNNALADKPDMVGLTPLTRAASSGHDQVVDLLLQRGALVDLPDLRYEDTPLNWAVNKRHKKVVMVLMKAKADPDKKGNVHTPRENAEKFPEIRDIIEHLTYGEEISESALADTLDVHYDLIRTFLDSNSLPSNSDWNSIPRGHFSQLFLTLTPSSDKILNQINRNLDLDSFSPDPRLPHTYLPPAHLLKADEIQSVVVPRANLTSEAAHRFRLNRIFYSILSAKYKSLNYHRIFSGRAHNSDDRLILNVENPSSLRAFFSDDEEQRSQSRPQSGQQNPAINAVTRLLNNEFPESPKLVETENNLDTLRQIETTLEQVSGPVFDKMTPYVDRYMKDSRLLLQGTCWNRFVLDSIDKYLDKYPINKQIESILERYENGLFNSETVNHAQIKLDSVNKLNCEEIKDELASNQIIHRAVRYLIAHYFTFPNDYQEMRSKWDDGTLPITTPSDNTGANAPWRNDNSDSILSKKFVLADGKRIKLLSSESLSEHSNALTRELTIGDITLLLWKASAGNPEKEKIFLQHYRGLVNFVYGRDNYNRDERLRRWLANFYLKLDIPVGQKIRNRNEGTCSIQ